MNESTGIELNNLLEELAKDPYNLDLINRVAIGYFENYDQKKDKEDFDYFEKAYHLKKTVKSTHNFAWFLYFEWSEIAWRWNQETAIERALKIQQESISLQPQSYLPYYLYGYMLLDQKRYQEALRFLEKANAIESRRDILHNLGYGHFQLGDAQTAFQLFKAAATESDLEQKSRFNLTLAAFATHQLQEAEQITKQLFDEIEHNVHKVISGYEVGFLYFLLKKYPLATECLFKQGIDGIDLFDWPTLSYGLYSTDISSWENQIQKGISSRMEWVSEIESGHEDWEAYTDQERHERLTELKRDIQSREAVLSKGMTEPVPNLSENLLIEYCGCLLFDCKRHGNRKDDH